MTTEPVEPQPTPKAEPTLRTSVPEPPPTDEPTLRTSVPEPPDHGEVESQDPNPPSCGDLHKESKARYRIKRHQVRLKYDDLFWRQPNVHMVGEGYFSEPDGSYNFETGKNGIVVTVTEKVDQSTLPKEDRIPDCLEGVSVQIEEAPRMRIVPPPPYEPPATQSSEQSE